jgi:uncharacterized protein YndB with AHSA1/START domain
MTVIRIVRDFPHSRAKVWRALTDPELMALWGMRPEGFAPVVGTRYKLFGKPNRMWRGFIECEVLEARAPERLRYSWIGSENAAPTQVTYELEARGNGTRLTLKHEGFAGVGGFVFANLLMRPGIKNMVDQTFPRVLAATDDTGTLLSNNRLKPLH